VLGTSLAWLVAAHRFRGRGLLVWLLALPLAIPAYVSGFVVLDTFDRSGPVRSWWGDVAGAATWYPEVRSLPFAALVLTLALYPYVYLLTLGAFRDQAAGLVDAARTLGCSRREAFVRVALPAARPAVIAGSASIIAEVDPSRVQTRFGQGWVSCVETTPAGAFAKAAEAQKFVDWVVSPAGQAVTQAKQPRQVSKCFATVASSASSPASIALRAWMRPRGESISVASTR
jgi:hypothetical protein